MIIIMVGGPPPCDCEKCREARAKVREIIEREGWDELAKLAGDEPQTEEYKNDGKLN